MLAYPRSPATFGISSNNATWTNQYNFISTSVPRTTTAVGYIWKLGYSVIQNVNYIITYAPDLRKKNPDSASVIDNILAPGLFPARPDAPGHLPHLCPELHVHI